MSELIVTGQLSEEVLRFGVRNLWRKEGLLDGYKSWPLGSRERGICLSEAHKIEFEEARSHDPY